MCWNTYAEIRRKLGSCTPNELTAIRSVINDLLEEYEETDYYDQARNARSTQERPSADQAVS